MTKTKTIKLGFFPFWVVAVYGGTFTEMVEAAVKEEPLLNSDFFDEPGPSSTASVFSDENSNVCVAWFKPKAYEKGHAAFYSTVAHEAAHIISAMRLSVGAGVLEEETYAYLLQYLVEEIGSNEVEGLGAESEEDTKEMQLVGGVLAMKLFDRGTALYTSDGDVITKMDRRRSFPFFCETTGLWYCNAYVATHPA